MIVGAFAQGSERSEEERKALWEELSDFFCSFDVRDQIIVPGDLNARLGDVATDGISGGRANGLCNVILAFQYIHGWGNER